MLGKLYPPAALTFRTADGSILEWSPVEERLWREYHPKPFAWLRRELYAKLSVAADAARAAREPSEVRQWHAREERRIEITPINTYFDDLYGIHYR